MKKLYFSPYRIYTDWMNDSPIKQSWDLAYCRYVIDGNGVAGIIWQGQLPPAQGWWLAAIGKTDATLELLPLGLLTEPKSAGHCPA